MEMDQVDRQLAGLRDQFLLRPGVVFLNHGSFGACPRPVFETYQHWQLELERQPVEFLGRRFETLMREAREGLGAFLGADADESKPATSKEVAYHTYAESVDRVTLIVDLLIMMMF